jgi:hypothetical protein
MKLERSLNSRGKPPTALFEIHKEQNKIKPSYTESYRRNIKAVKIDQSRVLFYLLYPLM